jgi:hypothetical protein
VFFSLLSLLWVFIPVMSTFVVEGFVVPIVEGFVVPVVEVLLSHFVEYLLLLSSTVSTVDNILLQPCLWSILWQTVHQSI